MAVRAKFKAMSIARDHNLQGGATVNILLTPVTSGSKENEEFYKYTPGGEIRLFTVNEGAGNYFVLGCEYYLDFTRADQPESTV